MGVDFRQELARDFRPELARPSGVFWVVVGMGHSTIQITMDYLLAPVSDGECADVLAKADVRLRKC